MSNLSIDLWEIDILVFSLPIQEHDLSVNLLKISSASVYSMDM